MKSIKEQVEEILESNSHWTDVVSVDPEIEKRWKLSKLIIFRKIVKDLEVLQFEERRDTGNNQVFTLVMSIVIRELHTANFQAKCGTFPVWLGIFSRAKGVAKKNTTGVTALNELSKGILKNGKAEQQTGRTDAKRVVPSASPRPRS